MKLFKKIDATIQDLDVASLSIKRKEIVQPLITFIQEKVSEQKPININFICTHNSRRSHLSQVWAQALAGFYKVPNVSCYSGGTEATAMFPMAGETLKASGFEITKLSNESNPVYSIKYTSNAHSIIGFSKRHDNEFNPQSEFAAIMTCSQADQGCPFIPGAEKRIPIMFEDPKAFDNTPQQAEKYMERSMQIATELKYVFSQIKL